MSPPFVYPTPQPNPYMASIGELMLHQGDIRANEALQLADINAKAITGVTGAIGGAIQQAHDPKRQLEQQQLETYRQTKSAMAATSKLMADFVTTNPDGSKTMDPNRLPELLQKAGAANVPPQMIDEAMKTVGSLNDTVTKFNTAKVDHRADIAHSLLQSDLGKSPAGITFGVNLATMNGLGSTQDGEAILDAVAKGVASGQDPSAILKTFRGQSEKYKDLSKPVVLAGAARPGASPATLVNPLDSSVIATGAPAGPERPPPPTPASLAVAAHPDDPAGALAELRPTKADPLDEPMTVKTMENGKPVEKVMTKRAAMAAGIFPSQPAAATGNAEMEQANAKTVAAGIIAGNTAPSILEGTRGTAQGMALMAEINRLGGNSDSILRNWTATKRAISSLDSPQQIRLAQTINKASASLDKVEELNKEWQDVGARFGIKAFNRASLTAAQNGVYGPKAASVAQRLDGQIADVTGEIGQAIMGGNSPTDHGFELAGRNLKSDWTADVLSDAIKQTRYNLNLAQNARNDMLQNLGVTSTQVHTPEGTPTGRTHVIGPNGETGTVPAGTSLPAGWKAQ